MHLFLSSAPPNLLNEPANQALFSSMVISLSCAFEGRPLPNVTWTYVDEASSTNLTLTSQGKYNITNEAFTGLVYSNVTSVLSFHSDSIEDAGTYTCTSDNGIINLIDARSFASIQLYFETNGK